MRRLIDEKVEPCDGARDRTPNALGGAIELCDPWVVKSQVNADGDPSARGSFTSYGATYRPKAGSTFVVLSTGVAGDEKSPGFMEPQPGTEFDNNHPNPAAHEHQEQRLRDVVLRRDDGARLRGADLHAAGAQHALSFSFQFNFMSSEYPEWVGSEFNDKFLAILDSKAFKETSRSTATRTPSPSTSASSRCATRRPSARGRDQHLQDRHQELNGTGYQLDDGNGIPQGGGTGWLTTTSPVVPGETVTLRFIIFDEGDHILDSAVLIDNFQWQLTPAAGPMTIP